MNPFFLSYASNDGGNALDHFITELNTAVRRASGREKDGYVAPREIGAGKEWGPELVDALCTSQVLVCLYSPSFFRSQACGKEMQVFRERRRLYMEMSHGRRPANIVPVLWHPYDTTPASIPDIQVFPSLKQLHANLKQLHTLDIEVGVYGLPALHVLEEKLDFDYYDYYLRHIALRIVGASKETPLPLIPPERRPTFRGIRSAFDPPLPLYEFDDRIASGGPDHVTFVYANYLTWDKCLYAPPDRNAMLHVAASVADGLDYIPSQVCFDAEDADLINKLTSAVQKNNVILTLVDGRTLTNIAVQRRLQELDSHKLRNTSTLIVWPEDATDGSDLVRRTFPFCNSHRAPYFYPDIRSLKQLRDTLPECIEQLKLRKLNDPENPRPMPPGGNLPRL